MLIWDVEDAVHRPLMKLDSMKPKDLDTWCDTLRSDDSKSAYQAVWKLVAVGDPAVPKLKARLSPAPALLAKDIARWILELDHTQFPVREKAKQELVNQGDDALVQIDAAVKNPKSVEQARRLQTISQMIREGRVTAQSAA